MASTAQAITVDAILVDGQSLPGRSLVLPEGHCVQVRFAASITDGPDIDLFVAGYGVTAKPQVARDVCITDVTGRANATPFALRMVRVLATDAEDSGGSVSGS